MLLISCCVLKTIIFINRLKMDGWIGEDYSTTTMQIGP